MWFAVDLFHRKMDRGKSYCCFTFGGLEDAHTRAIKRMAAAGSVPRFFEESIGSSKDLILRYAQHA